MRAEEREALRAAMRLDYPSFPCLANKRPACPHGFKDACTATSGLATLWARYPGELVGVPTGTASGISVLDVDRGKGGGDWWLANRDRLPATRLHRTRSGGIHAVFKHRTGLRNSVARIAPGIDVRAEGGYIVWWPLQALRRITPRWPTGRIGWSRPSLRLMSRPRPIRGGAAQLTRSFVVCCDASKRPKRASETPCSFGPPAVLPKCCAMESCQAKALVQTFSASSRPVPVFLIGKLAAQSHPASGGRHE
jgi:hypothetical protein